MHAMILLAMSVAWTPVPYPGDQVVTLASELVPWCRAEAEARYVAAGITPYQWTASHQLRGRVLHVDGRLRAGGEDIPVRCRLAAGARLRFTSVEIDDPRL